MANNFKGANFHKLKFFSERVMKALGHDWLVNKLPYGLDSKAGRLFKGIADKIAVIVDGHVAEQGSHFYKTEEYWQAVILFSFPVFAGRLPALQKKSTSASWSFIQVFKKVFFFPILGTRTVLNQYKLRITNPRYKITPFDKGFILVLRLIL